MNDDRPTPPARPTRIGGTVSPLPPRASPRPDAPELADPFAEEPRRGDGINGTSPGTTLARLKEESKARKKRKPWYAALISGAAATLLGLAGTALRHSFHASESADAVNARLDERLLAEKSERERLQGQVGDIKTDVAVLKSDMTEMKQASDTAAQQQNEVLRILKGRERR